MLTSTTVLNAVLASLQSIPQLTAELGGSQFITAHYSYSGEENSLMRALGQMREPSMLIAYNDIMMGNFDGQTMWKHRVALYVRARNAKVNGGALSAPDLLAMAVNYPITVPETAPNIRYVDLCNHNLWLFSLTEPRANDELGQDFWSLLLLFDEMGDAGPDGVNFMCIGPGKEGGLKSGRSYTE
jgi:hypothetical protein